MSVPFDGKVEALGVRHSCRVRVRYGETDAMGYVYYGVYPLYFEVGRNELMRECGVPYSGLEGEGVMMPAVEMHIGYGAAARYDDVLEVHTGIVLLGGASLVFGYRIDRPSTGEMVAYGWTRMAVVDQRSRRPIRLPGAVRAALGGA